MPKINLQKGERLIAEIRKNEVLYDPAYKDYSDLALKAQIWNTVAVRCSMRTGHEAKLMWKNLRDCYRICRSKLNVNPKARMWRFYKQMEFLAPYIKYRKVRNVPVKESLPKKEVTTADKEETPPKDISLDLNDSSVGFTKIVYWDDVEHQQNDQNEEPPQQEEQLPPGIESRMNSPFDSDGFDNDLQEVKGATAENSLKLFFDAMCASTSGLPLRLQRLVKNKVFMAVLEAEEEAEQRENTPLKDIPLKLEP